MPKLFSHKILVAFAILFFGISNCDNVLAAQSYIIAARETKAVNEWGVCQKVTNAAGWPSIFVPTNSETEWTAFRNNRPGHITLGGCETPIPSNGTVSIWVQHGCDPGYKFTYNISVLPKTFNGNGEQIVYTISRVGNYIKVNSHFTYTGFTVPGGNINAVKIYGPDFPDGKWAASVISYKLGVTGIAESVGNALGDLSVFGYLVGYSSKYTYLGDGESEIVLSF